MYRYKILAVIFSVATLLCSANISLAADTQNNTSHIVTGVISSNGVDDGTLDIGDRSFEVGIETVVISRTNKVTSYHRLRRGMNVSISFQSRGDTQFPLALRIKILN